jgi:hypothetical protein
MPSNFWEPGSAVCTVARLRAGRSGVWVPVKVQRNFIFSQTTRPNLGAWVTRFFPRVKQSQLETDYSLPSSVEVNYEWSYTCMSPIRLDVVDKGNFTFITFTLKAVTGTRLGGDWKLNRIGVLSGQTLETAYTCNWLITTWAWTINLHRSKCNPQWTKRT